MYGQTASAAPPTPTPDGVEYGSPGKNAGAWKLRDVRIKPSANGGFIAECNKTRDLGPKDRGPSYDDKEYAFSTFDELVTYLRGELGAGASAAPASAASSAPSGGQPDDDEDDY